MYVLENENENWPRNEIKKNLFWILCPFSFSFSKTCIHSYKLYIS